MERLSDFRALGAHRPRRVPAGAWWREHAAGMATGLSWIVIGVLSLFIARTEGLAAPSRAGRGDAVAWLVALSLLTAGVTLVAWAVLRGGWWSRVQRHGRTVDAVVREVNPVGWLRVSGRAPVDLVVEFVDWTGTRRIHRLRVSRRPSRGRWRAGQPVTLVYAPSRPEELLLHWNETTGAS